MSPESILEKQVKPQGRRVSKSRIDIEGKACALARPYRCAKDVGVHPIVISELELIHIEREIFAANLVERATMLRFTSD